MTGATAILVTGMHRSGTSALAGALNVLGVPLGQHLLEPGPDNPKGYWEHGDIVAVHERLLAALGSRWDDVRALPEDWLASEAAVHAAAAIGELVTRDFADRPLWAVKDPRMCRFLPLWFQVLRSQGIRPVVLLMVRDPGEVAASIDARNHWRTPIGEMLWLRYVTEAATASRGAPRSVVVYDELLDAPLPAVSRALAALKVDVGSPPARAREELAEFIDKADRHHVHDRQQHPANRFVEISQVAYGALRSIAHGDDAWVQLDKATADFDAYWQRHGLAMDALAGMSARLASDAESEWAENRRLSSQLGAQISWSEQAVQKQEALQAEGAELASKLNAQVTWSEQATKKQEALQAENAELASKLNAQVTWSEQATKKHEALQADNAGLQSQLTAQISWSEQAQQRIEALQAGHADLQQKLTTQIQHSEQAMQKRDALTAELAQAAARLAEHADSLSALRVQLGASESARRELAVEQQRAMDEAGRVRAELAAQLKGRELECERLAAGISALRLRQSALEAELQSVYASRSWRMTQPFRRVAGVFGAKVPPDGNDKRDAE